MPGYYSRSMPITPPDSGSGYGFSSMHYSQDPYVPQQPVSQCRQETGYDYPPQGYLQPAVAPPQSAYQYPQSSFQPANSLPPISNYFEPAAAPTLPPLRIQDHLPFTDDYQRRLQQEQQNAAAREQQRQASKEEKATGGVSAKLDYDMERMTDFVTEATQSIFQHQMQSHPSFRKWVHQVLSATRLPSATILLSLHYLNDRMVHWPESVGQGENQIYRFLAVALILGSKFLDDNTFINRSWSDVTAIKVLELNMLEMKWLQLINYELHIDVNKPDGLQAWLDAWQQYDANYAAKMAKILPARLSPLDTNVHRHGSINRDPYSPYPTSYTASTASTRSFDAPLSARSSQFSTPYSAADPWAPAERQMDDYYKRQGPQRYPTFSELEESSRRASEERARLSAYQYTPSAHQSYYQTPTYGSPWDQSAWSTGHRYDCNCSTCAYQQHYRPYSMASGYAAQTVMG